MGPGFSLFKWEFTEKQGKDSRINYVIMDMDMDWSWKHQYEVMFSLI